MPSQLAAVDISTLLDKVNKFILNPIIGLLFAIAVVYFLFGLFQFIQSETTGPGREAGKKKIIYGLVGMLVMFGAYGIIHIIISTFGISNQPGAYINF